MSKPFCDDEEQIIIAAKTDPEKFGELYRRYHPRIFRYVFYRVSNAQVADDLTSLIFERAISKLHTYRPDRGTFIDVSPWNSRYTHCDFDNLTMFYPLAIILTSLTTFVNDARKLVHVTVKENEQNGQSHSQQ